MKNLTYLFLALIIFTSCDKFGSEDPLDFTDSISMGAGYANDIFYSMGNGVVKTSPRDAWDIAFSTYRMSSTILINEGLGIKLYTYPHGDKDSWDDVDTTGIESWAPLYNSDTSWYFGAFDRNSTGHPDYGWGQYNDITHDVTGDSLFIIQLSDGSSKKLFIESRAAGTNSFNIKYGALGETATVKEIFCNADTSKNFVYFSFASGETVDVEPDRDSWDIVFTKYHDESIPYIVTGILSNMDLEVAEVSQTDTDLADASTADFSSHISVIGSDWKEFDMGTFSYVVQEDLCYFVKKAEDEIYKLVFTGTDGSASGKMVFDVEEVKN